MPENEWTIAVIMLHGGCDMKCRFCITDDGLACMTKETYGETLLRIQKRGFQNIVLGGGEPFLWPAGLGRAAKMAADMGFYVQVGTNGVRMPDADIHRDCVSRYVLPMDASHAEGHNAMRRFADGRHRDHYALMVKRLCQLRAWGRAVTVSTVVSAANLDDITGIGDYLADYVAGGGRLHAWHLYRFIPQGRGGARVAKELNISDGAFDKAVCDAREQSYPYTIFKRPDMRHSATVDFFWYQNGRMRIGSEVWGDAHLKRSSCVTE